MEEFRLDFAEFWQKLPDKAFLLAILAAWVLLFAFLGNSTLGYVRTSSLFSWLWDAYNPPIHVEEFDESHGNLVPFAILGLLWWKRAELMAVKFRAWWPGLILLACCLALHVIGYAVQQPRVSAVALYAGIYSLTGLVWGPDWLRASFFPFCLFAFLVPLGTLAQPITFPLRVLVSKLVELASPILAIDVIREGTVLKDPTGRFQYEVAAACSGIRSLVATMAIATIYAFVSFRPWWKRGVLLASGFPLAVLGNFVRMMTIVIAADMFGQQGGNYVHEGGPAGILSLLPYVPAFAGLIFLGHWLRDPKPPEKPLLQPQTT